MEKKIQVQQPSKDPNEEVWKSEELVKEICTFVSFRNLSRICSTNKMFRVRTKEENDQWKKKCIDDFGELFEESSLQDDLDLQYFSSSWHHYNCGIVLREECYYITSETQNWRTFADSETLQSKIHDWQSLHQCMHIRENVENMMKNARFGFFRDLDVPDYYEEDRIRGFILQADHCGQNWTSDSLLDLLKPQKVIPNLSEWGCKCECKDVHPYFWSIVTGEKEEETNETHEAFKKLKDLLSQNTKNVQQYIIGDRGQLPVVMVGYHSGYLVGAVSVVPVITEPNDTRFTHLNYYYSESSDHFSKRIFDISDSPTYKYPEQNR